MVWCYVYCVDKSVSLKKFVQWSNRNSVNAGAVKEGEPYIDSYGFTVEEFQWTHMVYIIK